MTRILKEADVVLQGLAEHLEESGWDVDLQPNRLVLHTQRGVGLAVSIDSERQFISLFSHFPLHRGYDEWPELVNTLNSSVFLAGFHVDDDGDLIVSYAMSYERGLILAQFARIVRRFGSLLHHVLDNYGNDQVFALGRPCATTDAGRPTLQ